MKSETIQRLLDEVEECYIHPRNQENIKKWKIQNHHALDNKWREVPASVDVGNGQIPLVVNMEPTLRSAIFGYSVKDYFHDPAVYLENYLKHEIFHFHEINDDVPVLLSIPLYRSAYFEATLCGVEIVYLDDEDAVLPKKPYLENLAEVEKLSYPDFNSGESMAYAKQLYEYVREQIQGREFTVTFMEWLRNPFDMATWLYGEEEFMKSMTSNTEGCLRLLDYVTESRIRWTKQRAQYLGEEILMPAEMFSDNVRMVSSQQFAKFVKPYIRQVSDLHGGIRYWHCCGNMNSLLEPLSELPIDLFHVGPWTDVQKAAEVFGPKGVALEICVQKHGPYGPHWPKSDDIFFASPKEIETKVRQVVTQAIDGGANAFFIEAGPLHLTHGIEADTNKIKEWVKIARNVLDRLLGKQ